MKYPENMKDIIQRHITKGYTEQDAIAFVRNIQKMYDNHLITEVEMNNLLQEGTIDCIGH